MDRQIEIRFGHLFKQVANPVPQEVHSLPRIEL